MTKWEPCDSCGMLADDCWNGMLMGDEPDVLKVCCEECDHPEAVE